MQVHQRLPSTPVHVLTGFLGSGKTTLLQRMLADPAMADTAVLINEFGEIGLDHDLLERIDETVVLMKSGCLCCTVRGEIADALLNLHSLRARGRIAWFGRVVIETTGLADPYPVLSTIRAHPVLRSHFSIGCTIATVDAVNGGEQLGRFVEAVRQAAAADVIVVTKTDLALVAATRRICTSLAAINPTAPLHLAPATAISAILADATGDRPPPPLMAPALDAAPRAHTAANVRSFVLEKDGDLDWTAFGVWLTALLNRHGDRILRVKGILNVAGEERPVAIHGVQRLVHPPVHMAAWPDGARQSRLVFIFEGLDPQAIRRSFTIFNALGTKAPSSRPRVRPVAPNSLSEDIVRP